MIRKTALKKWMEEKLTTDKEKKLTTDKARFERQVSYYIKKKITTLISMTL